MFESIENHMKCDLRTKSAHTYIIWMHFNYWKCCDWF